MDYHKNPPSTKPKASSAVPLDRIVHLLCATGTPAGVMPPPTALYKEGWMLRLVLDWFDQHRENPHPLEFAPGAVWQSEALPASQFKARHRGDRLAESWTHADGVIGHLRPPGERGDAQLQPDAAQLVVVEAKMGSGLSAGTTRAARFDQAARNIACIVESVRLSEYPPHTITRLGWVLLAPKSQIADGVFGELSSLQSVEKVIRDRVAGYEGEKNAWLHEVCLPILKHIDLTVLSWEAVLDHIAGVDSESAVGLSAFYQWCLKYNLRSPRTQIN